MYSPYKFQKRKKGINFRNNKSWSIQCVGDYSQCAPGVFNLDQKFRRLFCFCDLEICKMVQNQLKKPSANTVP